MLRAILLNAVYLAVLAVAERHRIVRKFIETLALRDIVGLCLRSTVLILVFNDHLLHIAGFCLIVPIVFLIVEYNMVV